MGREQHRNAPCQCGSGRKYKHCCLLRIPRGSEKTSSPASLNGWAAFRLQERPSQATPDNADTLLEQGDFAAAAIQYRQRIADGPCGNSTYINLGIALKESGRIEESLESFGQLLKRDSRSPEAHLSLASGLVECGRFDEALVHVREALRLKTDFAPAYIVLGMIFAAHEDWEQAIAAMAQSMAPEVSRRQILNALAGRLLNIGLNERAQDCFKLLLQLDPTDVGAQHLLASLTGRNPDHPDDEYIRRLFDQYADTFDKHVQTSLGYTVPGDLVAELRAIGNLSSRWDVLDLGCGTGLVGFEIAPLSCQLVGVDLSPQMIKCAGRRNVYSRLECSNLMAVLAHEPPRSYDVITAADVLLYVGRLDDLVSAVAKTLRSHGLFAFTTEAAENSQLPPTDVDRRGYQLTPTGRYAHTQEYLERLALRSGFKIERQRKVRLRTERRHPVMGWLSVWAAP